MGTQQWKETLRIYQRDVDTRTHGNHVSTEYKTVEFTMRSSEMHAPLAADG